MNKVNYGWERTVNGKYLLRGVGRVLNCTCYDYNHPMNPYHTLNCESSKNLTLTYKLNLWERLRRIKTPPSIYNLNGWEG